MWLMNLLLLQRGLVLATLVVGCLTALSHIGLLTTGAYLLSIAALQPSPAALAQLVVGVRFFGLARAVSRYAERYWAHSVTFRLLRDIRVMVYTAVEKGDSVGLAATGATSRMAADVDALQFLFLRVAAPVIISGVVLIVLYVCFSIWLSDASWVLFVCFAVYAFLIPALAGKHSRPLAEAREKLACVLTDSLAGMDEVFSFQRIEKQQADVLQAAAKLDQTRSEFAQRVGTTNALGVLAMQASLCLILYYAIDAVGNGLSGVYLAPLVLSAAAGIEMAKELPQIRLYAVEARAAARRLSTLLNAPATLAGDGNPASASLQVNNLSFCYRGKDHNALTGIFFSLPPGKKLAIVGPSGSGKSSLIAVFLRLADYTGGSVMLGGRELRELSADAVRAVYAAVPQENHLFHVPLRDNILLARPEAAQPEWKAAAQAAGLTPVVETLPAGFDTVNGWRGRTLSGGESRRVALARALLRKDAPILLLDEPTEGLDAIAARAVMAALLADCQGRSLILATHRLSGLASMDEILVLEDGRVAERGSFRDLIQQRALFYRLWRLEMDNLRGWVE